MATVENRAVAATVREAVDAALMGDPATRDLIVRDFGRLAGSIADAVVRSLAARANHV